MFRTNFMHLAFDHENGTLIKGYLKPVYHSQGSGNFDVHTTRCVFDYITAEGDGALYNIEMHDNRKVMFTECTFTHVQSASRGGAFYFESPTIEAIHFTSSGKGFTIQDVANGGYDCVEGALCTLKSAFSEGQVLGKVLLVVLTDNTTETVLSSTDFLNLAGLNTYHMDFRLDHVFGWTDSTSMGIGIGSDVNELVHHLFTLEELMGERKTTDVDCPLIDAVTDREYCLTNRNSSCTIEVVRGVDMCVSKNITTVGSGAVYCRLMLVSWPAPLMMRVMGKYSNNMWVALLFLLASVAWGLACVCE